MGSTGLIWTSLLLLVTSLDVCTTDESPLYTTEIDCSLNTDVALPSVNENYEGVLELVTGIPAETTLELDSLFFPEHLDYIEMIHKQGETSAEIHTTKPLNVGFFFESSGKLYYEYKCKGSKRFQKRELSVVDINQSPEFPQDSYNTTISETTEVDSWVLKMTAEDVDTLPEYSTVTYSIVPPSEDFMINSTGFLILKRGLNFNVLPKYNFTVIAQDQGGLNDTATVLINVKDFDNLNPYFSHNTYQAVIPENEAGFFKSILPEAIKAQDGDTGINMPVIYSISSVFPEKYDGHFSIDSSTGVLSVLTAFDREEMSSNNVLIRIKAAQTDDARKTAEAVVEVTVEEVNESPPVFDQDHYSVTLLENSPNNYTVFRAIVTDADQGGFVGTLEIVPESTPFTIDDDGIVRVKNSAALDRETTNEFTFKINAVDTVSAERVVADVTVTLEDENDNTPSFTSDTYKGNVFVNQTVGMLLVQVDAEDGDAGINGQIKYSVDFGNQQNYFSIDENTGAITLVKLIPLKPYQTEEFLLFITATDGGAVPRSSSAEVQINAFGDTKPQFNQDSYQGTIEEESDPGTVIVKVTFLATESTVTLLVDKEHEEIFNISSNGELSTKRKLDYDDKAPHNYSVTISITDGVHTDYAVVNVQVTDINDNSPIFISIPEEVQVSEDTEVGSIIIAVSATDKDSGANGEIRYSLTGGEGRFVVHPESGVVTLAADLDREIKAEYQLQVVAEDLGRPANTANVSLQINVTDVNDNAPKFSQAEYQVQVSEDQSVDTILLTLSATDLDEGDNSRVTYTIVQQSPSSVPAVFKLDPTTGSLQLARALDYSEAKEYRLVVQASDGGTPTKVGNSSVVVKVIDVNNNPPVFDKVSYNVNIPENLATGVIILTVKVTDKDEGGFNGTLKVFPESSPFSIDSDGIITVRDTTALDRETTETITFQVKATEATPPNNVVTANVSVTLLDENDNSPKFLPSDYEAKILSNQKEGTVVIKVDAVDGDAGNNGQIKYSIDFGNQQNYFSINESTGAITLVKIIPLEPHQTQEFFLVITATDGGVVPRDASVQVRINAVGDTKPQFNQDTYQGTIEEESDPGTVIVKVDFLPTNETSVSLQVESEEHKEIFDIKPNGELSTKRKLDYDDKAPHKYSVRISITDGVHTDYAVVNVQVTDINDNSPIFNPIHEEVPVSEDMEVGSNIITVSATDKDSGANGEIRYSLTGGEGRFVVHPESGVVTLAAGLDREIKAEYQLQVVAEDQGCPANVANASLRINVTDVNDNAPKFSQAEYQVQVPEDQSIDSSLLTLSATDLDEGENSRVSYTIVQQSPSSDLPVFELDSTLGTLTLSQPLLDYSEVKEYRLVVQASDRGAPPLVGNSSVVLKVMDVNNNPPEFDKVSYNVNISENPVDGAPIFTVKVTDKDEGGFNGTLKILPESTPFAISSDGTITVRNTTALDRETTETITFQVKATEATPPNHVVTANVSVTLLDENDNSPEFIQSNYSVHIFSNQTEGMLVVKVNAEDDDAENNGQIKYSIDFGNQQNYFSISESTGAITLVKIIPLEPHQTQEFLLVITATDGGVVPRDTSVQVWIKAVGDTKPQFNQDTYQGTIEEESDPGTVIVQVGFLPTNETSMSLQVESDEHKEIFDIKPNGELSTKRKLDYDDKAPHKYSVRISITDGVHTDYAVVNVQVTDINDNSPIFNPIHEEVPVSEDTEVGSNIITVSATDKDSGANGEIRYSLTGGEGRFVVHPESGVVTLAAGLDREVKAEYQLQVVAEDLGCPANVANASLRINVTDVNDNAPKFSQAEYQVQVPEDQSIDSSLLTLSATDLDEGENSRVSYTIVQQSPSSDLPVFELDSTLGTLTLSQPLLDYSEVKEYRLVVQASDGGTPTKAGNSSVVVKVMDVNNNPPEFDKVSYNVNIPENLANGVTILTVKVTDKDEGGFNGTLKVLPESSPFSIDSDGIITVRNTTALDRETSETITFEVEATEATTPNHSVRANVSVTLIDENDNSPEFRQSDYEAKILSNQKEGTEVIKVGAVDDDAGVNGQVKYSIDFGNQQNYFSIDKSTGAITLEKRITLEPHQTEEFFLVTTATDGGAVPCDTSVQVKIIAVGDTKPHFDQKLYEATIEEERDPGTVIIKVDFLTNDETTVTLNVDKEHEEIFNISSNGELSTKRKLDYDEAPHKYSVNISITDGVDTDYAVVNVQVTDVNDNSPIFISNPGEVPVSEDVEVGSNIITVSAKDKDSGANGEIRYSLTGGEGRFVVHPESGVVTLAAGLDREVKAEYQLQVVAEDLGCPANTANVSLRIRVTDVNDNAPKFSQAEYQVQVPEDQSIDTSLLTLSATDLDEGENSRVSYTIVQQSPSSDPPVFELDSTLGTLTLSQPLLDYSKVKEYRLVVQASDGGAPPLVGNSSVVVKVIDVNNNPPKFDKDSYDVNIPENLASGATILILNVTDRDEGGFSNGHFSYKSDTFDINNQGVVSLRNDVTLDRETKDSYTLQVVAVDQASDGLNATAVINISILDYNDNAPQIPNITEHFEVLEGDYSERPNDITNIKPTDPDLGPNGEVTMSIFPPNPLFRFREDGTLMAVGSLDRESRDTHELVVTASDNGNPQRQSITNITVRVLDVNDNKPEFSSSSYFSSVLLKDVHPGKEVLKLEATDKDSGRNSLVTYSFLEGGSPYLSLNSTTGAITLTSNIANVTEHTLLEVTALAQDHGEHPLNATASVVVILRVAIPEGVVFIHSYYNFSLFENEPVGTTMGKVQASSGSDLYSVSYNLTNHNDLFSVDTNGTLQTRAPLDKEGQEWYILEVEAKDTRTPPTSAVAKVTVWVRNVNEPPKFLGNLFQGSVFSIAPYKSPIVTVTASDPDVGDSDRLNYSIVGDTLHFDVEPSSGLVYVVSVADLAGTKATVEVKVSDPHGLEDTTTVEVTVNGAANKTDVVVLSINQPANRVEEKISEMESTLGSVLGWTVHILDVRSDGAVDTRSVNATSKTLVSFISMNGDQVVPSEQVIELLKNQSDTLESQLKDVFGEDVDVDVDNPSGIKTMAIILVLVLIACLLLLIVAVLLLICLFRKVSALRQRKNTSF